MKKTMIMILTLSVLLSLSVTASAHDWQNDRHYNNDASWRNTHHNDYHSERGMPFSWHTRYHSMRDRHHLQRIEHRDWDRRFPGLRAYRWNGEGFWHHGHYVSDAVLFFDRDNELVSVGYMHDGAFIFFREDHQSYESRDSFFVSWWRHR